MGFSIGCLFSDWRKANEEIFLKDARGRIITVVTWLGVVGLVFFFLLGKRSMQIKADMKDDVEWVGGWRGGENADYLFDEQFC